MRQAADQSTKTLLFSSLYRTHLGARERDLERVALHRAQEALVELFAQLSHHLRLFARATSGGWGGGIAPEWVSAVDGWTSGV